MTTVPPPVLLSYRTLGLGDLLTAVPALRALRATHPDHRHLLATPAWLAPLVAATGAVDVHLPVDELAAPLVRAPVDVAVNLHGSGPRSHRVLEALGPRRLIAHHHPEIATTAGAPEWRPGEHEVQRWCRLLVAAGIPADPRDLSLIPPPGPVPVRARGATVLHPGAKAGARRWPAARFAQVAGHERARRREVVITGSHAEAPLARAVGAAAGLDPDAVLAGRLDVGGLARVVAAAGRVVCGDTGVGHLATAVGTPSVLLFGPTSPSSWGPPEALRDRHRVIWAGRTGDPHADVLDAGLATVQVRDVLDTLAALP